MVYFRKKCTGKLYVFEPIFGFSYICTSDMIFSKKGIFPKQLATYINEHRGSQIRFYFFQKNINKKVQILNLLINFSKNFIVSIVV